MIDPLFALLVSVLLGLLLAAATLHKLTSFDRFSAVLRDYQLLPGWLCRPAAWLIVCAEGALAVGWLSRHGTGWVAPLTAGLFALYGTAIAANLLRGRVHISCGCGLGGGASGNQPLSWWLVLRNALLVAACLLPVLPLQPRPLHPLDWATLATAVLTVALLHFGASQLLKNRAEIRAWRNPRG
jgi:hypothetical protein